MNTADVRAFRRAATPSDVADHLSPRARLRGWLDLGTDWQRPQPTREQRRADVWIAVAIGVLLVVWVECVRSLGYLEGVGRDLWQVYALALAGVVPLAWRRRFPLVVAALTQLHFVTLGVLVPQLFEQIIVQLLCFFGLFSGVAWGRDRRATLAVVIVDLVGMFGWVAVELAVGNAAGAIASHVKGHPGWLSPALAWIVFTVVLNLIFFVGCVVWGQNAWRAARDAALVAVQAETISAQGEELRERAVVDERLRIARELHDVVAHHVSVMGVQAGAARRVLDRRPDAAAEALLQVESSARDAVREMRALLGTLRASSEPAASPAPRGPEPGLNDLPALVEEFDTPGLRVTYSLVVEGDPAGGVPPQVALSVYRIVQESLSNVRAHSSARTATVVVRHIAGEAPQGSYIEAEVVDDGRPLGATSGTGLGLLGMRERIAAQGGRLDVGPRLTGGYRVRARFPLDSAARAH